jgi:hypothetical protein
MGLPDYRASLQVCDISVYTRAQSNQCNVEGSRAAMSGRRLAIDHHQLRDTESARYKKASEVLLLWGQDPRDVFCAPCRWDMP